MQIEEPESIVFNNTSENTIWHFQSVQNRALCRSIPIYYSEFERNAEEVRRAANVKIVQVWRQLQSSTHLSAFVELDGTWRTQSRTDPIVQTLKTAFTPFVLFRSTYSLRLALFRVAYHCRTMLKERNRGTPRWSPALRMKACPIYDSQYGTKIGDIQLSERSIKKLALGRSPGGRTDEESMKTTRLNNLRLLVQIEQDLNEMKGWQVNSPTSYEYIRPLTSLVFSPGAQATLISELELELDNSPCPRHVIFSKRLAPQTL